MDATVWSDYLCPWCYLGQDRSDLLRDLGLAVRPRAYELHPEVPPQGRPVPEGGRLASVLDAVGAECAAAGLPFSAPSRLPNTRLALAAAEVVRVTEPDVHVALDRSLFEAVFADGDDLGDLDVVLARVDAVGAQPAPVADALRSGRGAELLAASMIEASEAGVSGTPAWRIGDGLLVPGVQPRDVLQRWVRRLQERAAT